ncbi:integrase family protein [Ekhidna sp.]|jgi:integrase|uniref:tyrosine-type recombinase/integrase n=1 Tax=Ekhidna sp. TaxID=2608089 RepID=UPI0032F07ADB|tara:strand:+ start:3793 stop:5091 length:1299 start_codon:yes stop_codon:yes gene_type:complete
MVSDDNTIFGTPNGTPKQKSGTLNNIACNELSIKAIKPKAKRVDYWFNDHPGFGLRVTPKGAKSFVFVYRLANRKFRLTIGRYPSISLREARKKYDEALDSVELGVNPVLKYKKAKSRRITVSEGIDIYEQHCLAKGKVRTKDEIRAIRKDLEPQFGSTFLQDMESEDFEDVIMNVLERGAPQQANHLYAYMHRMCKVLMPRYLKLNPISALEKPSRTGRRTRALTFTEIHQLWYTLPQTPIQFPIQLALKFILVTMQRGVDVRTMTFAQYNPKDAIWTIPEPKNKREWRVPLNKYGVNVLEAMKLIRPGFDKPFLTETGEEMGKDTLAQSINKQRDILNMSHFTPHDLRRTAATIITSLGCPPNWAALMLNHTDNSVTSIYDQYGYDYEKRLAANVLEFALDNILRYKNADQVPSLDEMRELVKKANILQR